MKRILVLPSPLRVIMLMAAAAVMGVLSVPSAHAQVLPQFYDYPQNHLPWFTVRSEHFLVHYQPGAERAAAVVSRIAEEVYGPITELYGHEPDSPVSIVLKDREDYANGAAYFFDNKIDIWLPALDTPLRGTHDWLRNVISHEFTHIVQIQSMMTRSRRVPAVYLQWLAYENVRRPDVLYGFPRGIATVPFASIAVPAWFAEGTAQFQRFGLGYDRWDTHRDMLLRTRMLDGTHLDFVRMGTFTSKTSIERETVYNQGYAFSIYLADRFGERVLADISHAAADSGVTDFSNVIRTATGVPGAQVFEDFVRDTREGYERAIRGVSFTPTRLLEPEGFINLNPELTPDGRSLAWLGNGDRDYARTQLLLAPLESLLTPEPAAERDSLSADRSGSPAAPVFSAKTPRTAAKALLSLPAGSPSPHQDHLQAHGLLKEPLIDYIGGPFSFSPDGGRIVFSKSRRPNARGELYRDLWVFDRQSGDEHRLTRDQRLSDPAWHPTRPIVAAIRQDGGTQNLVLVHGVPSDSVPDVDSIRIVPLTQFENGEVLFSPRWSPDGSRLYAATAMDHGRRIVEFDPGDGTMRELLGSPGTDHRDPWPSPDGRWLYYAADPEGWFAIYRLELQTGATELVVRVPGGAFMPVAGEEGVFFAEYRSDGYKIAFHPFDSPHASGSAGPPSDNPPVASSAGPTTALAPAGSAALPANSLRPEWARPRPPATPAIAAIVRPEDRDIPPADPATQDHVGPYTETTTGLSVFPLIRMDGYTQLNGRASRLLARGDLPGLAENLARDLKVGAYFASRDVLDRVSLFGGLAIAPGSRPADDVGSFLAPTRLLELDRDLFLNIEYRGLPFIKRRWSPTVSAELINITRNVADGLRIEEFPCTSCLPDTTSADIRYTVWEGAVYLRSKLNRYTLLETGLAFSPYRVNADGFFSNELRQFIPESSSEYFRGTTLSAAFITDATAPTRHADIAPTGFKAYLRYRYQPGKLLDRYEIEDGTLAAKFNSTRNHSLELRGITGLRLPDTLPLDLWGQLTLRGFTYFNRPEDTFYLDYAGGFLGMRSYPYFALGGRRTAFARAALLTPLRTSIDRQVGPATLDKVFLQLFYEVGNAWDSPYGSGADLKHGIGAELRTSINGFYLFPLKFFVNVSYGLDTFSIRLPEAYIVPGGADRVRYGRSPLLYFGFTFDFDPL